MTDFNRTPEAQEVFKAKRKPKGPIKFNISLNEEQKNAKSKILSNTVTILRGKAGSGKSLLAANIALDLLFSREIEKIIITRPLVSVDEELGFLPGTFQAKMDPWIRPVFDILRETFSMAQIQSMIEDGFIEISPLAYMRGRTFKRSFIIADEMQNSSPNQMKMILTRIGEGSKMVITGDLFQSDREGENGLSDFMLRYNDASLSNQIACIELGKRDVHRSSIVSTILDIYEPEFQNSPTDDMLGKEISSMVDPIADNVSDPVDDAHDEMFYEKFYDAALIPRKWIRNLDW